MRTLNKACFAGAVAAIALAIAPATQAQVSGTVNLSGTVGTAVKLTSGGAATLSGNSGGGVTTQSAADAALATVVNFGDVGPANANTYVCFTQPLFIRANALSTVHAAVTAATFGAGANDLQKTDIGIGFRNLAAGGPDTDISTSTITAAYSADPCAAPIGATGAPTYSASLNSLATAAPGTNILVSTGPVSLRGSFNSNANHANMDMKMAIVPQSFTPIATFSATVTLTLTSP